MKKALLLISVAMLSASPAFAQTRRHPSAKAPAGPMIKVPPSTYPGVGTAGTVPSPTTSTYPKPITQTYDPFFNDPTQRNPNLRTR